MSARWSSPRAIRHDVFWRCWEREGGHDLVTARAEAFAALADDPAALAAYHLDPVSWALAFDAAWRKQRGRTV